MWIYIFEDGEVKKSTARPCADDLDAVDAGILQILDVSDEPAEYYDNEWHTIPDAETPSDL